MAISKPKVCVIGAGCSGITAVKNLLQAGVKEVVCYEQNEDIGGNWIYTEKVSHSSVCETTHIISSKKLSEYCDYPMPDDYPDYPSHTQVLAYFRSYAQHFNLYPYIQFNTSVEKAEKKTNGKWELNLSTGKKETFDYLLVANGHHSIPRHPELNGIFTGEYLHSHSYKNNRSFQGKKVLVIGTGNSGCDCAVEISRVAEKVAISMRRPQYIIPKFFLGRPSDSFNKDMLWLPKGIAAVLRRISLRIQVGDYRNYGMENPDYPVTKSHPTMNSELLYKIRHGKVHVRKAIEKVDGTNVHFQDGKVEEFDTIVAATGYKIIFPFFEESFLDYSNSERVPLYLRMFHPEHPTLIFIGLVQPQGAVWPLSDAQSKLAASYIIGRWKLPANIKVLAEKDSDYIEREFIKSKRHTIEVHYHQYLKQLQRQIPRDAPQWEGSPRSIGSQLIDEN